MINREEKVPNSSDPNQPRIGTKKRRVTEADTCSTDHKYYRHRPANFNSTLSHTHELYAKPQAISDGRMPKSYEHCSDGSKGRLQAFPPSGQNQSLHRQMENHNKQCLGQVQRAGILNRPATTTPPVHSSTLCAGIHNRPATTTPPVHSSTLCVGIHNRPPTTTLPMPCFKGATRFSHKRKGRLSR